MKRVEAGELDALIRLDEHGLIIGPDETPSDFARRIQTLKTNIEAFRESLNKDETIDFHGVRLSKENEIPGKIFKSVAKQTNDMWGFSIDWVPGYYTDDRMGILFAGCAMYSFEDMFAVFVVRKAFKSRSKWFLYERAELLSHELTHIAHMGFWTPNYEEHLAYRGSTSGFRRLVGGMFRRPRDTYMVLGSMVLLLLYQAGNILTRDPLNIWNMPTPLAFGAAFLPFIWLLAVYLRNSSVFRTAERKLCSAYSLNSALPILFRCSESEIRNIAQLPNSRLVEWVSAQVEQQSRWQVIAARFL